MVDAHGTAVAIDAVCFAVEQVESTGGQAYPPVGRARWVGLPSRPLLPAHTAGRRSFILSRVILVDVPECEQSLHCLAVVCDRHGLPVDTQAQ